MVTRMLKIPVYLRGSSYYLHTRIGNRQIKKSLKTSSKELARIKALQMLVGLHMEFDKSKIRTLTINFRDGIFESEGEDEHRRLLETLNVLDRIGYIKNPSTPPPPPAGESIKNPPSLRLTEVLEKFFSLKKNLSVATTVAYRNVIKEFSTFVNDLPIHHVLGSHITQYQEYLSNNNNQPRTIDNKTDVIRAIFNFAIKQKYYEGENPAANRKILSKKERSRSGYASFYEDEIEKLFTNEILDNHRKKDPDYYFCVLLGLITGARISEITSLEVSQIREMPVPHIRINDAKTKAGIRSIPIPFVIYKSLSEWMPERGKVFKYKERMGKGSGNAVSQKFKRERMVQGVDRRGLVFHSLRKFNNNKMKQMGVPIEARSQFIGHEFDNVNDKIYATEYSIEDLAKITSPTQQQILELIKYR